MGSAGISSEFVSLDIALPGITVSPNSGLITTEAGGTDSFSVRLNTQPVADVAITVSSSNAAEGQITSSTTLTFNSLNWNNSQSVIIAGQDDQVDDGDIAYTIIIDAAVSTDLDYSGVDPVDVSITNTDNDTAGITVSAISGNTTEAGGTATFTVVLDSEPTADVTVGLSSDNESEGLISRTAGICDNSASTASGSCNLVFTSANWSTTRTVKITGQNDFVIDGAMAYSIITTQATSDSVYAGINPADIAVTNTDDDTANITVTPAFGLVTREDGSLQPSISIKLTSQPGADVTIPLSSSNTVEGQLSQSGGLCDDVSAYAATGCNLVFTSANWNVVQQVKITGIDDFIVDGPQVYSIVIGLSISSDNNFNNLNPADKSVTNVEAGIKLTFVTAVTYQGNLGLPPSGGVTGADAKCMADANKPPGAATYKTFIAAYELRRPCTSNNCTISGELEHVDWVLLPNTTYTRSDGITEIITTNNVGIFVFGTLTNSINGMSIYIWTGLSDNWREGVNCQYWADNTSSWTGQLGSASANDYTSITTPTATTCNSNRYLWCIEQ